MTSLSSKAMAESSFLAGPRTIVPPGPTPQAIDRHFDFLEWSPDGDVFLLGTSSLTSRTWGGSIWLYKAEDTEAASSKGGWQPVPEKCLVGSSVDCGVTTGRFLRSGDKFVLGCDSGTIQVISIKRNSTLQKNFKLEGEASLSEHNDMVLDMDDLGGDGLNIVTCSQDKSIKIWDLESFLSTHTYAPAHAHIVTCVRTKPSQPHCFASCARDGSAVLWDIRDEQPASCLVKPSGVALTSLSWVNEMAVVTGAVNGHIVLVDIRNTSQSLTKVQLENRPIHSMRAMPSNLGTFAVCQDSSKISVLKFTGESQHMIYDNDSHEDFVRGLVWNPKNLTLWSCGWDSRIFSHEVMCKVNGLP